MHTTGKPSRSLRFEADSAGAATRAEKTKKARHISVQRMTQHCCSAQGVTVISKPLEIQLRTRNDDPHARVTSVGSDRLVLDLLQR